MRTAILWKCPNCGEQYGKPLDEINDSKTRVIHCSCGKKHRFQIYVSENTSVMLMEFTPNTQEFD